LSQPAAVFVGCDKRAIEVLDACSAKGLRVPDEISLLSVDNDELLCNTTSPALSSIDTAIDETGSRAVNELIELFRTGADSPKRICIDSFPKVVRRASCSRLEPGMDLARRAMQFISANAKQRIEVTDVVDHLGVSRRLADMRFRQIYKKSILDAITSARLSIVKNKLVRTRENIDDIALSCGFSNANYLKILFKRRMGMTMSAYRKAHATKPKRR